LPANPPVPKDRASPLKSGALRGLPSSSRSALHRRRQYRCEHQDRRNADVKSSWRTSIVRRRREVFVREIYPTCYRRGRPGEQIQVLRRLQAKLIHGLDRTKAMPASLPAASQLTPVSSIRVRQPTMTTNPLSTLH